MNVQGVTIHLSDDVIRRARRAADVLERPLEEVLTATLSAALPDVENAPSEMQAELTRMTWLSDQELWRIARSTMPEAEESELRRLTELQTRRALTGEEQSALDELRHSYGRITLLKARAYALLSLRGGSPLLASN